MSENTLQPGSDDWCKQRAHEFERYYKERDGWVNTKLKADESYDTLLAAISTLALGASLTKDWANRGVGWGAAFIVIGWICFALCLVVSLAHRGLTYYTYSRWIDTVDLEYNNWSPGAFVRASEKYEKIPFIKCVERLKVVGFVLICVGLLSAFLYLLSTLGENSVATAPAPAVSQTFNFGGGTLTTSGVFRTTNAAGAAMSKKDTPALQPRPVEMPARVDPPQPEPFTGPPTRPAPVMPAPQPAPASKPKPGGDNDK